ncbi:MAG TPA: SDR family NAD(P)-dependent oxidoreductase [Polyangiaceae bacterium]|jgi:uncharacterized oxidoreductase
MKLEGRTILVTGGATGIGFAFAERFAKAGSTVIVCGRREDALRDAKQKIGGLHTIVSDVGNEADRVALAKRVIAEFATLDVVVNNAGIQRRARLSEDAAPWSEREREIAINFAAPVHLASLFLAQLEKTKGTLVNVTSGLAFVPAVFAPVYCATKAAMHSFTVSLRHDLARKSVEVIEVIPPAVDTDLGGKGLHTQGTPLPEFADAVFAALAKGETEIGYGFAEKARTATRAELDAISSRMASS